MSNGTLIAIVIAVVSLIVLASCANPNPMPKWQGYSLEFQDER